MAYEHDYRPRRVQRKDEQPSHDEIDGAAIPAVPTHDEASADSESIGELHPRQEVPRSETNESSAATPCRPVVAERKEATVVHDKRDGRTSVSAKRFEVERRPGGCDIRPARPKPAPLHDDAEYAYASPSGAGGGDVLSDEMPDGAGEARGCGALLFGGLAVGVLVAMWLFAAVSPFLANALTLHGWRMWLSVCLGCLPIAFVLCLAFYAMAKFRKLPRVEQFAARSFTNKAELQRRLLETYLVKIASAERYAAENGFADGDGTRTRAEVVNCIKRLKSSATDSRGWLVEFDRLQALQDERAKEIITRTWELVAIKTAVSPWKIVDIIAVVYNSTIMVTRLARLYNRRTSRHAAFRLVCRWFINIYIAGEMGEASQGAVEWASANDLISSTYKPLAGLLGKVAEGGANAFLVYRLGRRAMDYFRPLC